MDSARLKHRIERRAIPPLASSLHASPLAHRVLAARGIRHPDELDFSLASLPLPDSMPGMTTAIERLLVARERKQRLVVVGDYDCDGATSTALAVAGLTAFGFTDVDYVVPDRFCLGYGLSPAVVDIAVDAGAKLILTVDNGISSIEGVAHAAARDVDVLITDHHLPPAELPAACALVNPNLPGSTFPSGHLAGVGVLFYLLLALRRALLRAAAPEAKVNLADYLDLVAIGTIADVVPLDGVNRILVEQGLRRIRALRTRPGVLALLERAGREPQTLTSTDIGYAIGPRLNAAGRLADMSIGVECLLNRDPVRACALAAELDRLNRERRAIEAGMQSAAGEQLEQASASLAEGSLPDAIVLFDSDWHLGVIGIVAGRLKEQLYRPVVVFTQDGDGWLKGSARSIPAVHIRDVLMAIAEREPGLIDRFGGHAMAAGLTLRHARLEAFRCAFEAAVSSRLGGAEPIRRWLTDGCLGIDELTLEQACVLEHLLPWGAGCEAPLFDGRFTVHGAQVVGQNHLKLLLAPDASTPANRPIAAIAFGGAEDPAHIPCPGDSIDIVYALTVNRFRGQQSLQLQVQHITVAATPAEICHHRV